MQSGTGQISQSLQCDKTDPDLDGCPPRTCPQPTAPDCPQPHHTAHTETPVLTSPVSSYIGETEAGRGRGTARLWKMLMVGLVGSDGKKNPRAQTMELENRS
ncbi:3-isopropylmalate dehydratase large subunit, partial [Clarias magur]